MKKIILAVLAAVVLMNLSVYAAPEATPQQAIETFLKLIRAMDFPIRDEAAHKTQVAAADAFLDMDAMGQKSLEAHWAQLSAEDRKAFLALLWKLIESVAYSRSHEFIGDFQITYQEVLEKQGGFEVHSVIKQADEALDAHVLYHVYANAGQWKIDDIVLDDVSIVEDLKYQFNKLIVQSQFAGLLKKMRERFEESEKKNRQ